MHREISHTDDAFHQDSNLSLYVLTGLVGLLIGIDLAPVVLGWLDIPWPLPREVYGPYRFALLAAIIGGARTLYPSIEALLEGRLVFVHVPPGGEPAQHTLSAPPAVYFSAVGGVQPAPDALVNEVTMELDSAQKATARAFPPPTRNKQEPEPFVSPNNTSG